MMFGNNSVVSASANELAARCQQYLALEPPASMEGYRPGSLLQTLISQGAQGQEIAEELKLVGNSLLMDTTELHLDNREVQQYLSQGVKLARELLS